MKLDRDPTSTIPLPIRPAAEATDGTEEAVLELIRFSVTAELVCRRLRLTDRTTATRTIAPTKMTKATINFERDASSTVGIREFVQRETPSSTLQSVQ